MSKTNIATEIRRQAYIERLASENARLTAENSALRRRLALTKRADEDNPAQPVPEPAPEAPAATTDETKIPDKDTEPTTPGGEIPPESAEHTVDVTEAGGVDPADPATQQEVTSPVADGVDHAIEDVRTEVDVNHDAETIGENFATGDWANVTARRVKQASENARNRNFACLRLARLRIQAGIAQGDDLELAMQIEASSIKPEAIRAEIESLTKVVGARGQAPGRPRQATAGRAAPSLASRPAPLTGQTDDDAYAFV